MFRVAAVGSVAEILEGFVGQLPKQGKKSPLSWSYTRDLTEADLILLESGVNSQTPMLLRIRFSHHALARCLADGKTDVEASLITGYSPNRISVLKKDPAFAELVAYYEGQVQEIFTDAVKGLRNLSIDARIELQTRLDEDPTSFSKKELMELLAITADRSGLGPTAKIKHEHNFVTDEFLEELRAQLGGSVKTIDVSALPSSERAPERESGPQGSLAAGEGPNEGSEIGPGLSTPDRGEIVPVRAGAAE